MSDVYILGIDMLKFGRFPDRTFPQLGGEAALLALADAGLSAKDVQALYCGSVFGAYDMTGQAIMREIGQTGVPVTNISNACATGASAFREAWIAILAGLYDVVLAVGVEKMPKGMLGAGAETGIPLEGLFGSASMPAVFAESGMEHAAQYGTTFEQFAKV
jgi:acetyl-CoA acetyltransferase